jgi:perosamine synthetase
MFQRARKMRVHLGNPIFDDEMREAAVLALQNERFVLGESVFKFEEEFARYCGSKFAVSTSSGTNALQFSLLALGVGRGDEVITTPYSFVASANVALHVNASPVFADVDVSTFNIDPKAIAEKVSEKTKAIIPVHLYGYPADMGPILETAKERGLSVVEDACQAHGAEYFGKKAGSVGDVGCFSFYPSKNMTVCGDGGMVVTDNEEVAKKVAKLRDCGRVSHYEHDIIGYTSRLNTVNAAIGRVQLRRLNEWNEKRRENAKIYDSILSSSVDILLPPSGSTDILPVYHLYVIRAHYRDRLREWLAKGGVQTGVHYPIPIHLQPCYKQFGHSRGEYPNSEYLSDTVLSLPMYPDLNIDEIEYVCKRIAEFLR